MSRGTGDRVRGGKRSLEETVQTLMGKHGGDGLRSVGRGAGVKIRIQRP
jgi:hypothetical protein